MINRLTGPPIWPELQELYHADWDILNHSHHHATKHSTDFYNEVTKNITTIKQKLDFTMSQFVVPGGPSDLPYEHEHEKDAFKPVPMPLLLTWAESRDQCR